MENKIDEEEIISIVNSLQAQRNEALNQLAQAQAIINKLSKRIKELEDKE
jgi:hypothetical protein